MQPPTQTDLALSNLVLDGWARTSKAYLRLTDSCITEIKVQGPSRTCNESKEEEEALGADLEGVPFVPEGLVLARGVAVLRPVLEDAARPVHLAQHLYSA